MVDRRARDILANALFGFMQGRIRSATFDETVFYYAWSDKTTDGGVVAISRELYSLYDDSRNEPIHGPDSAREALWRVLVFLGTDLDHADSLDQDKRQGMWDVVGNHWPFAGSDQWGQHQHLRPASLPEYDPSLIARRPKSSMRAVAEVLAIIGATIGVLAAAYAVWLWLDRV